MVITLLSLRMSSAAGPRRASTARTYGPATSSPSRANRRPRDGGYSRAPWSSRTSAAASAFLATGGSEPSISPSSPSTRSARWPARTSGGQTSSANRRATCWNGTSAKLGPPCSRAWWRRSLLGSTSGPVFPNHAAAGRAGRDRAGRLAGAGSVAARRRLDGPLQAGRRTGLPGGRPPSGGRALVCPVRPRPDVAASAGTAGDRAARARHLPVHPGGYALPVPRRRRRAAGRGGRDDATLAGRSRGVRGPRSVASRRLRLTVRRETPDSHWPDGGRSRRIAFAARGGGHATRAWAGVAAVETSRQPCGGADGRAGGGAGQGFPLANQVRRRAGEGREPAGLGDQRRAVPG